MARTSTPPIPAKMYRHFAVITIAFTALLALFADGENEQVVTQQVSERRQEIALRQESYARFGAPKLERQAPSGPAEFNDYDFDGNFGAPMNAPLSPRGGGNSGVLPIEVQLEQAGYPKPYIASLSPEERRKLLENARPTGAASEPDRRRQAAALAAASAQRSGSASAD